MDCNWKIQLLLLFMVFFFQIPACRSYDISNTLSAGGILAGVYQYQHLIDDAGTEDGGRGAFLLQPEASYTPTEKDQVFIKFGFAAGNGLNDISPFQLAPYAGNLEDDVKDINGRNRDYLLTVWYKHIFTLFKDSTLELTGGIIDATDYLDQNRYANDENTQFMNEALVNGPNGFFPSYDIGGAAQFDIGNLSLRGVGMNIGENADGNAFNFYGLQLGYTIDTKLGQGIYRIIGDFATKDFLDPEGVKKEDRQAVFFSFDQEFGDIFGGFLRFGWQDDKAAVQYDALYSGGINISGKAWGRNTDNAAVAYAYLNGGNLDIDRTQVIEAYVRVQLMEFIQLTLDLQYMNDDLRGGNGPSGFIYGIRLYAEF